jgi:hydrogenase large subunit
MANRTKIQVPLNRVEGDLELRVEIEDNVVTDAWSSGIMYRGFEGLLKGRGARDGLVLTPRVCGICTTGHLMAAVRALDAVAGAKVPPDAARIRNLALMTEHIQSDVRHGVLMFAVDFVNPAYQSHPLFEEAVKRYQPFKGDVVVDVIKKTKKVLEITAILGGQWPHSSFMVPGGIASLPGGNDIFQCSYLLSIYKKWYEDVILGCTLERWSEVRNLADLDAWLEERYTHRNSHLGFYIRFSRKLGFENIGKGHGNFLSVGSLDIPEGSAVTGKNNQGFLVPAGFVRNGEAAAFDQANIAEHVAHSWYHDYDGGRHPFEGETKPLSTLTGDKKYSWAKAPRYDGAPAETGPLAELVVAGHPLISDLVAKQGPNVFVRELARLIRPTTLMPAMETWLSEVKEGALFYQSPGELADGEGVGLTHASRGALGHWVKIRNGKIEHYQIITPTAWNGSPRDSGGVRGPWEEALIGVPVKDAANPVELGHVIRSFDACLVCTVHMVRSGSGETRITYGASG